LTTVNIVMMKYEVIKEMSTPELKEKLEDDVLQLNKLKMNHAVSPLENPMKIQAFRKDVARMKTELKRRELQGDVENTNKQ
jgi:large subunit ribosomal protein L29